MKFQTAIGRLWKWSLSAIFTTSRTFFLQINNVSPMHFRNWLVSALY
jgi:hypothetical protein